MQSAQSQYAVLPVNIDINDGDSDSDSENALQLIKSQVFLDFKENQIKKKTAFAKFFVSFIVIIVVFSLIGVYIPKPSHKSSYQRKKTLILISIDSFTPRYFDFNVTPTLFKLKNEGTSSKYLEAAYPSSTFPNHYSLVTGLYPESHGIVANKFFNPDDNTTFTYTDPDDDSNSKWWGGEPIWVTAEKNNLTTGTCMWPGSEATIGYHPTYTKYFEQNYSIKKKVDLVFTWLDERDAPDFCKIPPIVFLIIPVTLYIPEVDSAGHKGGPDSQLVKDALKIVDDGINGLVEGLRDRDMLGLTDIVVVSDHGMADISSHDAIIYEDFLVSTEKFKIVDDLLFTLIYPHIEEDIPIVYDQFLNESLQNGHFNVFNSDNIPERFHYNHKTNNRIPPILLGYFFSYKSQLAFKPKGMHGFDPEVESMHAIFQATGPSFPKKLEIQGFKNVEVYQLLCDVLDVPSAPNNSSKLIQSLLKFNK